MSSQQRLDENNVITQTHCVIPDRHALVIRPLPGVLISNLLLAGIGSFWACYGIWLGMIGGEPGGGMMLAGLGGTFAYLGVYRHSRLRAWQILRNPMTVYVTRAWPLSRKRRKVPPEDVPAGIAITGESVYHVRLILHSSRYLNLFDDTDPDRARKAASEIARELGLPVT